MSAAPGNDVIVGADTNISDPLKRVQTFINAGRKLERTSFGDRLSSNLTLVSASSNPKPNQPHVTFTFTVTHALCNALSNLHGGAAALIFDVTTTCAIIPLSRPGFWQWAGVTRSLNCSYMRPLPVGTKVLVEAEVVQIGKRLVSVRGIMKDEQGKVAVMCEHLKVSIDPEAGGEPPKVGGRL